MTTDQAALRFARKAEALRKQGLYAAAHDWQRMASQMRSLAQSAETLPAARATKEPRR